MRKPFLPRGLLAAAAVLALASGAHAGPTLGDLVDRYMARAGDQDPLLAASLGLSVGDPARLPDWSPRRLAEIAAAEDSDLLALRRLDPAALSPRDQTDYAILEERLEANAQKRVCRGELWDVSHITGWPALFVALAASQPVGGDAARAAALQRWRGLPAFVDQDIANLRQGLALGYSAPKSVVRRVIRQVDTLAKAPPEASPYGAPAARDGDAGFKAAFATVVAQQVDPALIRYRDFLQGEYLPQARDTLAVSELPQGRACYRALLRVNTTLDRDPAEIFAAGARLVAANQKAVAALGRSRFGTADVPTVIARSRARAEDHFASADDLLAYTRSVLAQARTGAAKLVRALPAQPVVVEPEPPFEEAAGVNSHYEPNPDTAKPAIFRLQMNNWATQTRADAAVTAVHETWPGHHLQIALARELRTATPFEQLAFNAAYIEGWARIAEGFGEEAGIYDTPDAAVLRRIWPGRGMVADPGLHVMGWSRAETIAYIVESGKFTPAEAADMVDRIAAMPGQLATYDTGALEIGALRTQAAQALGPKFDLRDFDGAVLDQGVVPLRRLRAQVAAWVSAQSHGRRTIPQE